MLSEAARPVYARTSRRARQSVSVAPRPARVAHEDAAAPRLERATTQFRAVQHKPPSTVSGLGSVLGMQMRASRQALCTTQTRSAGLPTAAHESALDRDQLQVC